MKVGDSAGLSDPGRVRRRNEDAFVVAPPLFVVADGMGGAQAGEIASRLAVTAFREYHAADGLEPEARLRAVVQEANRRIHARASSDPRASGMGTTVTAVLVAGGRAAIAHVGDSRAYRLRDGALEQLTQDHSLVADLVRSGRLTREEAEIHPQRSVITRALGTDAAVKVDSFSADLRPGDVFLLCSDGLTTMVGDETVGRTIAGASDVAAAARSLVQAANEAGGEDNVTAVLFAVEEGDADDEDTLSGLRLPPEATAAPPAAAVPTVRGHEGSGRRVSKAFLLVALVLLLFAGLAALALWGLSRAHFVGAAEGGRVAVYQGVPWRVAGVDLFREVYVSRLLAVQLSPEERAGLFDHDLKSEAAALARIRAYELEASPEGS